MKRLSVWSIAATLAIVAVPAQAQIAAAPGASSAEIDPARLDLARGIALRQIPPGTMADVMDQLFGGVMGGAYEIAGNVRLADAARLGGMSEEEVAELGEATLGDIMRILDPHWQERARRQSEAMARLMAPMMARMEGPMREAIAQFYARRFDFAQLREIETFLSTPTGSAFLRHQIEMTMDPAFMAEMMAGLPEIFSELATLENPDELLAEATADPPPPREFDDLTPAERRRLADLIGISAEEMKENWDQGAVLNRVVVLPAPPAK